MYSLLVRTCSHDHHNFKICKSFIQVDLNHQLIYVCPFPQFVLKIQKPNSLIYYYGGNSIVYLSPFSKPLPYFCLIKDLCNSESPSHLVVPSPSRLVTRIVKLRLLTSDPISKHVKVSYPMFTLYRERESLNRLITTLSVHLFLVGCHTVYETIPYVVSRHR